MGSVDPPGHLIHPLPLLGNSLELKMRATYWIPHEVRYFSVRCRSISAHVKQISNKIVFLNQKIVVSGMWRAVGITIVDVMIQVCLMNNAGLTYNLCILFVRIFFLVNSDNHAKQNGRPGIRWSFKNAANRLINFAKFSKLRKIYILLTCIETCILFSYLTFLWFITILFVLYIYCDCLFHFLCWRAPWLGLIVLFKSSK